MRKKDEQIIIKKIEVNPTIDIDGFLRGVKNKYYLFVFIEEYLFRLHHVGADSKLRNTLKLKHNNQLFDIYSSNDNRLAYQPIELKKSQGEDGDYYIGLEIIDSYQTNRFIFTYPYKKIYVESDEIESVLVENFINVDESTITSFLNWQFNYMYKGDKSKLVCYAYKNGSVYYPEPFNNNFIPIDDDYNLLTGIFFDGINYITINFNNLNLEIGKITIMDGDVFESSLIPPASSCVDIIEKNLENIGYTIVPL